MDPTGRIEPLATTPAADNEAARMHAVMREFMNSVVTVRNTYLGDLAALGWEVQDSQILFHTDADVEAFNGHLARINELTEQLQARQRAGRNAAPAGRA